MGGGRPFVARPTGGCREGWATGGTRGVGERPSSWRAVSKGHSSAGVWKRGVWWRRQARGGVEQKEEER